MIFENYFLVFFMYLTLEVINQERETAVMFTPRNYPEDKLDIFFCTGSCVKKKMFHVVLGTAGHQREDRLYGLELPVLSGRTFRTELCQKRQLILGRN